MVELVFAHGLRQGPDTLSSTGFDVHQDTEDYDYIEYTVVVKLTPSEPHEPPSAMRVVGAERHFYYEREAGAAGCFRAKMFHASVPPAPESCEHLKLAFFFHKSDQGERRAKRALGDTRAGGAQDEAQARQRVVNELNSLRSSSRWREPDLA